MDKDKLLEHADKLLEFVLQGIEESKEFVVEQTPLLVKEMITWGIVEHLLYVVVFTLIAAVGIWASNYFLKKYRAEMKEHGNSYYNSAADGFQIGIIVPLIGVSICSVVVIINLVIAAKAYFAPRVYLLETLRTLIKSAS